MHYGLLKQNPTRRLSEARELSVEEIWNITGLKQKVIDAIAVIYETVLQQLWNEMITVMMCLV